MTKLNLLKYNYKYLLLWSSLPSDKKVLVLPESVAHPPKTWYFNDCVLQCFFHPRAFHDGTLDTVRTIVATYLTFAQRKNFSLKLIWEDNARACWVSRANVNHINEEFVQYWTKFIAARINPTRMKYFIRSWNERMNWLVYGASPWMNPFVTTQNDTNGHCCRQ